jgi:hypothetical protein
MRNEANCISNIVLRDLKHLSASSEEYREVDSGNGFVDNLKVAWWKGNINQ